MEGLMTKTQQAIEQEIDRQMENGDNATIYIEEKADELKMSPGILGDEIINFCRIRGYDCTYMSDSALDIPKNEQHLPKNRVNLRFVIEPGKKFEYDTRADN